MQETNIASHAHIRPPQRSATPHKSGESGALRTAPTSYELLRRLVLQKSWTCDKLPVLEGLSVLALDLVNLRDVLLPPTQAPGAAVQGNVLHCFVRMKKVGKVLERTKTDIKIRRGSLLAAQAQATVLGTTLNGHATQVL